MTDSEYSITDEFDIDNQYWTELSDGRIKTDPDFVCSVAEALGPDDEVIINSRSRTLKVLGFEEQPSPGIVSGTDYPYYILWLRGNGTEYRMRWSHLGEYYPTLHTESELEAYESLSVKDGEVKNEVRATGHGKRVQWLKPDTVSKEQLPDWVLAQNINTVD